MSNNVIFGGLGIYPDEATERAYQRAAWEEQVGREADIRAAAFDLLDALETLVERDRAEAADSGFTDDEMTWLEEARHAIAKARGSAA